MRGSGRSRAALGTLVPGREDLRPLTGGGERHRAGRSGRAGLPPARVMTYIAMIDYIVLGSTVDDFARGFDGQAGTYAEEYPSLARALAGTDRDVVNDDAFETALRLILTELGAELSAGAVPDDVRG